MIPVLESKREVVAALCRKHGVSRLFVFGSALREDFRAAGSDLDFLIEFAPMDGNAKALAYFQMLEDLEQLFGTKIDLVMSGAVKNRYIAREIEATKRALYAA